MVAKVRKSLNKCPLITKYLSFSPSLELSEVVKDWAQSIKVVYLVVLPPFTSLNYILGKVFCIRITFLHKGFPLKGFYVAERLLTE